MSFKKKILCLLSLFLIYKIFIFNNNDLSLEKLIDMKDEVISQLTVLTSDFNFTSNKEYDSSDIEDFDSVSKEDINSGDKNNPNENNVFNSMSQASIYLRKQMVNRENTITIILNAKYYNDMPRDIFNSAVSNYEGFRSSEGDYLANNLKSYNCEVKYSLNKTILKYTVEYLSTYSEEQLVNKKVKLVLDKLDVYDKDEYTKIKAVHDYIVRNIKYDYDLKNYSAYDAIINKKVVCQGYATLTYKMLSELDIDCRLIRGSSKEGSHAWNIVKIGNLWYNLDNTWDASYSVAPIISYKHFLKSNKDFDNHMRDSEFDTNSFNNKYLMSSISYKK
ncbi:transglutaminase domain-containing protein [Terrisporobacter sp.]